MRLGLQECAGKIEFDLSTLRLDPVEFIPPKVTLTPQLAQDLKTIRSRMRDDFMQAPSATPEELQAVLQDQLPDGSFRSVDYKDDNRSSWRQVHHLDNTRILTRAYADPRNPAYKNPKVAEAARAALAWWGTHKPLSSNWWQNDMNQPKRIGQILLADPGDLFTGDIRKNALDICRNARPLPRYTGNNLVFIAQNLFLRALLEDDASLATASANIIRREIRIVPPELRLQWACGGIRGDGAYHQHGPQVQFGNYGGEFCENMSRWANFWKGTAWEFTPQEWDLVRHYVFHGFQWTLWKGKMNLLAIGRQIWNQGEARKGDWVLRSIARYATADPKGPEPYEKILNRNETGVNDLIGTRVLWNSAMLFHRRGDWMSVVRGNSVRVRPVEDDTNGDNALGRYFSDGTCLFWRTGNEYTAITNSWNWTRLPGTTLPATPIQSRKDRRWTLSPKGSRQLGETAFDGGATDGSRGAFIFTQNLDGVRAKKAYFFDDDAVYELGTDIQSTSPYEVATTINC